MSLLERDREIGVLARAVEAVHEGDGSITIVSGPAGVGKTALLERARLHAEGAEIGVLHARAAHDEGSFAYGVVRQLLEPAVAVLPPEAQDPLFAGGAGPAARVIGGSASNEATEPGHEASFGVLHGLYWLTANLALRSPRVLCVDDLHWCDRPSLRFLVHLARRLDEIPVAVVVALRPGEPESPRDLILDLLDVPGVRALAPPPLSHRAVETLVRREFKPDADASLCAACHRVSGGNPLYLRQVLRALAANEELDPDDVRPSEIGRYVIRRLERLGSDAVQLARALAVLGEGSLERAALVAGVDPSEADDLAKGLVAAEILAEADPFEFAHPVVRAVIEEELTRGRRDELHLAAALVLQGDDASADDVAAHVHVIRPAGRDWCVEVLRGAAHTALARGAPEAAIHHLARALEEPPREDLRVAVLRELGVAEEHAGRAEAAVHLREALDATVDPVARAEAALTLAVALVSMFRVEDGLLVLRQALDELGAGHDDARLLLEAELVAIGVAHPRYGHIFADRLAHLQERAQVDSDARGFFLAALALLAVNDNRGADGAVLAKAALAEIARMRMPRRVQQHAVAILFFPLLALDEYATLEGLLDLSWPIAQANGRTSDLIFGHGLRSHLAVRLGRLAEAETHGRAALDVATSRDVTASVGWFAAPVVEALVDRGEPAEAEQVLGTVPDVERVEGRTMLYPARGRLRLAQGRHEEAVDDFMRAREEYEPEVAGALKMLTPAYGHWRSGAALALDALGRRDDALNLAHDELGLARAFGAPRALGVSLRVAGWLERGSTGIGLLEEAVEAMTDSPAVLERARASVALGALLRRERRFVNARGPLRAGLDLAARCGARPLAAYARDELGATGARPRREHVTGPEALTGSELRVAQLAAGGATNREIAQGLYLSVKTVEMHLGRAYRKLGIQSRGELAQALEPPPPSA